MFWLSEGVNPLGVPKDLCSTLPGHLLMHLIPLWMQGKAVTSVPCYPWLPLLPAYMIDSHFICLLPLSDPADS